MSELAECGLQPVNISSKELELAKPVPYRSQNGGLKCIDTAPEIPTITPKRGDSILHFLSSSSDPLPSVSVANVGSAVARRQSFPERRDELRSEPGRYKSALQVAKVRSPAMTYKETNKMAQGQASVLVESVKERKQHK